MTEYISGVLLKHFTVLVDAVLTSLPTHSVN